MNALASDQAKRLAETIWNDSRLKGKVTAGLFVGEGRDEKTYPREMGEHHVIENRDAIIDTVPDIILTNFKMLDYGLMRQRFMPLWRGNLGSEDKLLKYIVLDELHTYDAALPSTLVLADIDQVPESTASFTILKVTGAKTGAMNLATELPAGWTLEWTGDLLRVGRARGTRIFFR